MSESDTAVPEELPEEATAPMEQPKLYHISLRTGQQPKAASATIQDLVKGETVMVQTDHGPEPAMVSGSGIMLTPMELDKPLELLPIIRRATGDEIVRYQNMVQREQESKGFCQGRIQALGLEMKLLRVERYFNGSKIIFYFSAETRVDFRDLVKSLVQEFRTRVEMRQIGVRHETQMVGGIGCCGRELCCGLFMKEFVPVSIKMAKEQDLPLNPAKISGVCNRLLCCLTHEYETYKALKKGMPKVGRIIVFEEKSYKVNACKTLNGTVSITAIDNPSDTRVLTREELENGVSASKGKTEPEEQKAQPPARQPGGPKPPPGKPSAGRQGTGPRPQAPGRPPYPARQPPSQPPPPAVKPAVGKGPAGRPGPPKVESDQPAAQRPSRPRRARGQKKGKLP